MAGGYGHVRPILHSDDDGSDKPYRGSWSLIENMYDAYECIEELLYLVLALAGRGESVEEADRRIRELLDSEYYPMVNGKKPKDGYIQAVENVMNINGQRRRLRR